MSRLLACSTAAVMLTVVAIRLDAQKSDQPELPSRFGGAPKIVLTPESVWRLIVDPSEQSWQPQVNTERARGAAELYPKVAPAVAVVRTDSGHGTGFLVDAQGTIVTNHHVVEDGLRHDPVRRASYAMVHLGTLGKDGVMTLQPQPRRAWVHKYDPHVDLAVLRLETDPKTPSLPYLSLAPQAPRPGVAATVVGHPAAGMLWTIRTGEVASIGRMPTDMVNVVMTRLAASDARRDDVAAALARLPSRRILLTSAGINPGDSGGPVVDAMGRVIAVTFAVPASASLAKFAYHVHLDELRAFLANVPAAPRLVPPDPWTLGPRIEIDDLDSDNRPDILVAGYDEPESFLFDLDNDTPPALTRDLDALVAEKKWNFEVGFRRSGDRTIAFYDSDNDGTVDLILSAEEDASRHARFTRDAAGRWQVEIGKPVRPIAAAHFKAPRLGARLEALFAALRNRSR